MLYCPKCGGQAWRRSGVHFEHEWRCVACHHHFEADHAMKLSTKLKMVENELQTLRGKVGDECINAFDYTLTKSGQYLRADIDPCSMCNGTGIEPKAGDEDSDK